MGYKRKHETDNSSSNMKDSRKESHKKKFKTHGKQNMGLDTKAILKHIHKSDIKQMKLVQATEKDKIKMALNANKMHKMQKCEKKHKLREERLKMLQIREKSKHTVHISKQSDISELTNKSKDSSTSKEIIKVAATSKSNMIQPNVTASLADGKPISSAIPIQSKQSKDMDNTSRNRSKLIRLRKRKRNQKRLKKSDNSKVNDKNSSTKTDSGTGITEKKVEVEKAGSEPIKFPPKDSSAVSANWKAMRELVCHTDAKKTKRKASGKERHEGKKRLKADQMKKHDIVSDKPLPDIWFTGVDPSLLGLSVPLVDPSRKAPNESSELRDESRGKSSEQNDDTTGKLVKEFSTKGMTHAVAMDCEMVGVSWEGKDSVLARVSIVNQFGHCVYDTFVKAREKVTDYRTFVSGVRESDLRNGEEFGVVQKKVADILKGRVLVGHAVHNDLKVLFLSHPHSMIRDTQAYRPFRDLFNGSRPSLKKLTDKVLGVQVQKGEHSSVQDAQATMRLYTMYKKHWEKQLKEKRAGAKKDGETSDDKRKKPRRHRLKNTFKKPRTI